MFKAIQSISQDLMRNTFGLFGKEVNAKYGPALLAGIGGLALGSIAGKPGFEMLGGSLALGMSVGGHPSQFARGIGTGYVASSALTVMTGNPTLSNIIGYGGFGLASGMAPREQYIGTRMYNYAADFLTGRMRTGLPSATYLERKAATRDGGAFKFPRLQKQTDVFHSNRRKAYAGYTAGALGVFSVGLNVATFGTETIGMEARERAGLRHSVIGNIYNGQVQSTGQRVSAAPTFGAGGDMTLAMSKRNRIT